jgi:hypothetical protein
MPLTSDWSTFFAAELGALAALTGFIVVAISINLTRILAFTSLPSRAFEALIVPVGALTATGLVLVPEQPALVVGTEVLAVGLAMLFAVIVIQTRSRRANENVGATKRMARAAMSAAVGSLVVIGGALLATGARAGLYWIAAGDIVCMIAVVLSAWVLLIEIMR